MTVKNTQRAGSLSESISSFRLELFIETVIFEQRHM